MRAVAGLHTPALQDERGMSLRPIRNEDQAFLRKLYASTREQELAQTGWPEPMRQAFFDNQFSLQHRHYLHHYPHADFAVIERRGVPVGRYYLDRGGCPIPRQGDDPPPSQVDFLLIDISLMPAMRGQGIATALIRDSQRQAAGLGVGMQLHVLHGNTDARRLYERLGFAAVADEGAYQRLRWSAPAG